MFNSIQTHHISSTSTIMKDLYYLFPELFTFETKSNYYDLVFMGRFKKYFLRNLCLIITYFKRELRFKTEPKFKRKWWKEFKIKIETDNF